tara:strand:- start:228 stop:590 length:363 start_codon:yes stop_codon:yes gene_type:complete
MKELTKLLVDKGEIYLSRKSISSPYRLGIRFKGLEEKDQYPLHQLQDKVNYKFYGKGNNTRCISTKMVRELFDVNTDIEKWIADICISNPKICEVLNNYNSKNNRLIVENSLVIDGDLPF